MNLKRCAHRLALALAIVGCVAVSGCVQITLPGQTSSPRMAKRSATQPGSMGLGMSPARAQGRRSVTIRHKASIRGGILHVTGTATVPEGAKIDWKVGRGQLGKGKALIVGSGRAKVRAGRFSFSVDVKQLRGRGAHVWLEFIPTRSQPADVAGFYGAGGRDMSGPQLLGHGDINSAATEFDVAR